MRSQVSAASVRAEEVASRIVCRAWTLGKSVANHAIATIGSGDPEPCGWSDVFRVASTEAAEDAGGAFTQHAVREAKSYSLSSGQGECVPSGQQSPPLAEVPHANAGEATPTRRPNQITSTVDHRRSTISSSRIRSKADCGTRVKRTATEIQLFHETKSIFGVANCEVRPRRADRALDQDGPGP